MIEYIPFFEKILSYWHKYREEKANRPRLILKPNQHLLELKWSDTEILPENFKMNASKFIVENIGIGEAFNIRASFTLDLNIKELLDESGLFREYKYENDVFTISTKEGNNFKNYEIDVKDNITLIIRNINRHDNTEISFPSNIKYAVSLYCLCKSHIAHMINMKHELKQTEANTTLWGKRDYNKFLNTEPRPAT